jgi:hypothetical protein
VLKKRKAKKGKEKEVVRASEESTRGRMVSTSPGEEPPFKPKVQSSAKRLEVYAHKDPHIGQSHKRQLQYNNRQFEDQCRTKVDQITKVSNRGLLQVRARYAVQGTDAMDGQTERDKPKKQTGRGQSSKSQS